MKMKKGSSNRIGSQVRLAIATTVFLFFAIVIFKPTPVSATDPCGSCMTQEYHGIDLHTVLPWPGEAHWLYPNHQELAAGACLSEEFWIGHIVCPWIL